MTELLIDTRTHLALALVALAIACTLALPLGIWAAYAGRMRGVLVALAAVGRTLPSLAVLTFVLPFFGFGFATAIAALVVLAVPPIVINTDAGLRAVPAEVLDAARGVGMSPRQIFARVAWPRAFPQALAGVRTAAIEVVAGATLATFIGAGGLGDMIVRGLQTDDARALYLGALAVAALALLVEGAGALLSRRSSVPA